ncbi:MAG: ABC transporter ATP-binding protein [Desulfocurvibacter africanus]
MLSIRSLGVAYQRNGQRTTVLDDISLDIDAGEFVSILGPSGCGKTTLLRCLAGLTMPTTGEILHNGARQAPGAGTAMVFQDYMNSLFPWKTVQDNVAFALHDRRLSRRERKEIALRQLATVGLAEHADRHPWELSGGMQQRVAIARALAREAGALLMDEPFASLDAQTRYALEDLLLDVWRRYAQTVLFVTHDIDESIYLSDRIVVLGDNPGVIRGIVTVDLSRPRHQLNTRADSRFTDLRAAIHDLLAVSGQT